MIQVFKFLLICGLAFLCGAAAVAQDGLQQGDRSVGAKKILIFGDVSTNNPDWQQELMEKSLQQVADTFKAHAYEVDLIPTKELSARLVKERLSQYARTLTTNDTFVMYSHSHGGPRGTFFANWPELANDILVLPARDVVIFTMSCYSGNLTDTLNKMKPKWEGRSQTGRSLVVLTPVSASQLCGPSPERGIGNPFTYAVTTATQGAADGISGDKNGRIEMKELVDYVLKTTHEKSRGKSHTPQFAGEYPIGAVFVSLPPALNSKK